MSVQQVYVSLLCMQQRVEVIKLYIAIFVVIKGKHHAVHEISDIYISVLNIKGIAKEK
jgi:hypothetical protein